MERLERDADRKPRTARISAIIQVVPVVVIIHVDVVVLIPVASPVFWNWINDREPITTVLKPRIPANFHKRQAVDAERVAFAVVAPVVGIRNAIAIVPAALLPRAVLRLPIARAALLPNPALFHLLRAFLLPGAPYLRALLIIPALLLLNALLIVPLLLSLSALLIVPVPLLLRASLIIPVLLLLLLSALLVAPVLLFLSLSSLLIAVLLRFDGLPVLVLLLLGALLILILLLILSVAGRSGPEEQQQKCCSDKSKSFHGVCLSVTA